LPSETAEEGKIMALLDAIGKQQNAVDSTLGTVSKGVVSAGTQFSCLEAYKGFKRDLASCDSGVILTHDTASAALNAALDSTNSAAALPVPAAQLKILDTSIENFIKSCLSVKDTKFQSTCIEDANFLQSTENRLNATQTAIIAAQTALQGVVRQVTPRQQGGESSDVFKITQPFMRAATVTVVGTEIVTNAATTVATVAVNWQQTPFVLSTGLMGSGLANKTYAVSSVIVNGVVQTDPATGKNLSKITANSLQPAMDFPMIFGSWTIPWLSRWSWEYHCPAHCAFLLSAGAGLNLAGKTADFSIGPSFEIGGVLLTPSLVWGRQTVLADGITEGYTGFGINPPSTVPTAVAWKRAFGIALTYTLPTP
jgi:hypothetical protein